MTINEILLFAKILAFASGDRTVTVTDLDKKMAADAIIANKYDSVLDDKVYTQDLFRRDRTPIR